MKKINNPFYYKSEQGMFVSVKKTSINKNCKHDNIKKTGTISVITVVDYFKCLDCNKEIEVDYGY